MSEPTGRRPLAFRVGEEARIETAVPPPPAAPEKVRVPRAVQDLSGLDLEPEDAIDRDELDLLEAPPASRRRRRFSFGKLLVGALGALVSLGIGLAVDSLVRDLFERNEWLGWVALGLAVLFAIGALGVAAREMIGLMRLAAVDRERRQGLTAYEADSAAEAETVVAGLAALLSGRPETADGRARLAALREDVIDGRDMIALAERELLLPLDRQARALVLNASKRVSVVTAVSPKALVDVAYVLFETVRLIRQVSELYGARPGAIGLVRLTRDVLAHLAVTGSIAIGDGLMQQVIGHGLASKLSARLGEGVVNGLLTARVGLAAMDLCRPLPFLRLPRPRIGDFLNDLIALTASQKKPPARRPGPGESA